MFTNDQKREFQGANEYQHDVDIVIEIPEKGEAVQFGRFNKGDKKIQCRCGDSISPCSSTINYKIYQRLCKFLQTNRALEIASTTWPDLDHYSIRIVYKINKLTGLKHSYLFTIGKIAITEEKKNRADKQIAENIYLDVYKDH